MALFVTVICALCDTYIDCQLRKVNFLKLSGEKQSFGAKAAADFLIPELMKFQ
jgi:hypothetical protein